MGAPNDLGALRFGISTKEASALTGYTCDYIGQLCRTGKLECQMFGNTWFITESSLMAHKNKAIEKAEKIESKSKILQLPQVEKSISAAQEFRAEEFLPILRKNVEPVLPTLPTTSLVSVPASDQKDAASLEQMPAAKKSGRKIHPSIWISGITALGVMSALVTMTSWKSGALVATSTDVVTSSVSQVKVPSAAADTSADSGVGSGAGSGLVVVPSSGSVEKDATIKKEIRDSFSDQVEVKADTSGTAGVITPVFRKSNGKDFIYVMVPVKDQPKASPP